MNFAFTEVTCHLCSVVADYVTTPYDFPAALNGQYRKHVAIITHQHCQLPKPCGRGDHIVTGLSP